MRGVLQICRVCRYSHHSWISNYQQLSNWFPQTAGNLTNGSSTLLLRVISFAIHMIHMISWIGWCPQPRLTEKGNRPRGFNAEILKLYCAYESPGDLVKGGACDSAFLTSSQVTSFHS